MGLQLCVDHRRLLHASGRLAIRSTKVAEQSLDKATTTAAAAATAAAATAATTAGRVCCGVLVTVEVVLVEGEQRQKVERLRLRTE